MVMEVVHEEMADGSIQCTSHPYKNSTPGGICAFCLQEKLGKLVSAPFPVPIFPSSSSSPPFRSVVSVGGAASSTVISISHDSSSRSSDHGWRRSSLPSILTGKKKKRDGEAAAASTRMESGTIVFRRSKSTAIPGRAFHLVNEDNSGRRRGFWSFLYTPNHSSVKKRENTWKESSSATPATSESCLLSGGSSIRSREKKTGEIVVVVDENGSPDDAVVDRKVSRSRSIGCGSRSFSGDFFERISTGFGDCTLRRAESQREGKSKAQPVQENSIKGGRVRCGIFSGLMMGSPSSSSSSYWVCSAAEDSGKANPGTKQLSHFRRSWGWGLASPMRALSAKKACNSDKNKNKNNAASPVV